MKLVKVEITNFRCFESLSLSLKPDVNVIVGINGAGKTAILDAISVALYDMVATNVSVKRDTLRPTDIRIDPASGEETTGRRDFVQVRAAVQDFYPLASFPCQTPAKQPVLLEWNNYVVYQPPRRFRYGRGKDKGPVSIEEYYKALWQEIRKADPKALIPLTVIAYYPSSRRINESPS